MISSTRWKIGLSVITIIPLLVTNAASASDVNREQAKANFIQADINQDRVLDFNEFTQFVNLNAEHGIGRAGMIRRFGMHSRAFGKLDTNRDGIVTPEELAAAQQQ
ncbi:MAG: hypothetical protein AAFY15_16630 [Cyanobacteria bacterium J06648_11]